ncbi:hypothetical protein SISNIDRAFT_479952 [Sistotremastrum niveocremeum HHB9708]|uniref:DUF1776-domain-containing protein n=1 Tax=Sistotremastrum niveocremeum HHB9708 TaxID=1314777 RepID=A0A164P540_9AGAM|nr:hypothetical protein SISNIDRAFT_479952 [Sistotremastrum niveocremeum HHB9708]
MVPSRDEIERYLEELDEWVITSLHSVTPEIPPLSTIAQRIWNDLAKFGPPALPQIPGLGSFEVPLPPPPPPPPKGLSEKISEWIVDHKWKAAAVGVGFVVGSGLLAGYAGYWRRTRILSKSKKNGGRKRVAGIPALVVLGADSLIGLPLVLDLEKSGFIVIASVASPEAAENIQNQGHGYIRALILDPSDQSQVPEFLRSLQSTLSLRFPISVAGDPYYKSPASEPHIHTVISLLSLPSSPSPTALEQLAIDTHYLPFLQSTHITPLFVIQGLLPLFRVPGNARVQSVGLKNLIVCVPVVSRLGVAWSAADAMSTAATVKGMEVLRRELQASGQLDGLQLTVVDVGSVGPSSASSAGATTYMTAWSSNLRAAYGNAFLGSMDMARVYPRTPEDPQRVAATLVRLANRTHVGLFAYAWPHVKRVGVGAGVVTYQLASSLPTSLVDLILALPAYLVKLRNDLLSVPLPAGLPFTPMPKDDESKSPDAHSESEHFPSGGSSDADIESLEGDRDHISGSWISLHDSLPPKA